MSRHKSNKRKDNMALEDYKQKSVKSVVDEVPEETSDDVQLSGSTVTENKPVEPVLKAKSTSTVPNKSVVTVVSAPASQRKQTIARPAAKPIPIKIKKLNDFIKIYKDKVVEYRATKSNDIKLWKHFWDIANYILMSKDRDVMDIFFSKFVSDEDLNDNLLALRMIYETKDARVKNLTTAFFSIMYTMMRKSKNHEIVRMSTAAIKRTFSDYPAFTTWVNAKRMNMR